MSERKDETNQIDELEKSDSWWYRVYIGVLVFTIFMISALGYFSWFFSN